MNAVANMAGALALAAAIAVQSAPAADPAPAAPPAPPAGLPDLWADMVALVAQRPWSATQWTRGIYLGTQIFRYGAGGVPYMNTRFSRAKVSTEAFLSGVYVTLYGADAELVHIRSDLETDPVKRKWLQSAFGSSAALAATMEEGEEWQPALRCLPATTGCRKLAMGCIQSTDPLVRRAGLYWGFWVADGGYWNAVRRTLKSDTDSLNRRFAAFLMRKGEE